MNNVAKAFTDNRSAESITAWPHHKGRIAVTEDQVRDKVATTFAAEFGLAPGQLADDTLIKKDLSANFYELAGPIMTIENFFRTQLQDELASDNLSVGSIVDKLMGRHNGSTGCGIGSDCACAA
jgi:hypothetical protein